MREVGWHSRDHAARIFRQAIGVTPTRYRQLSRQKAAAWRRDTDRRNVDTGIRSTARSRTPAFLVGW